MIDIINAMIRVIGVVFGQVVGLLPTSPLTLSSSQTSVIASYMGPAAWFLPLSEIGVVISAFVAAILIWYGVRIVLRFFRVVAS